MKIEFDDILDIFKQKYSSAQYNIDLFILGWNECVIGWNPTITDKSYSKFSSLVSLKDFDYFLFSWNCCEAFFYNVNGIWQLFEKNEKFSHFYICTEIMKTFMKPNYKFKQKQFGPGRVSCILEKTEYKTK